MNLKKETLLKK